jgi:neutral amino acid transport system permease protein
MRPRAPVIAILLAACTLGLVLLTVGPATAQDESIGGTLQHRVAGEREPVEGVTVMVFRDGTEVGSAVSDADGAWRISVPGPGDYSITIDVGTLPEGVALTDETRTELQVSVTAGQSRRVVFQLGEGPTAGSSVFNRVASLFIVGLKLGAIIALSSIGLSLIFAVTGLVNFAHAELVTIGAVTAYFLHAFGPQWPLVAATVPALALGALLGWSQEKGLWLPLRRRGMGLITLLVVSIGLGFALRFLVLIVFGGRPRAYPQYAAQGAVPMLGIPVVPKQLVTIAVAVVVLVAVGLFLQRTQTGTALRAVRDNPDLSESSGINVDRIISLTWVIGGVLAALGGVFFGLTESVQWDMGFRLLLVMFAAVILGGIGTTFGTMLGSFVVGVAVEMSVLVVPTELKIAVGLVLLIVMLLVRPQGLLGVRERIG